MTKPYILKQITFGKINSPLLQYSSNVYSQNGEDGIISHIIKKLSLSNYFVELGAWDGIYLSNVANLALNSNWSGLFIEANRQKFIELQNNYRDRSNIALVNSFVSFEGENQLDSILLNSRSPVSPDILSIDIDGTDYFVWESLSKFTPKVVIVEFNPTIPNDVVFVQEKNRNLNHGCSLLALIILAKSKGYELICVVGNNAIFVLKELFGAFDLKTNSINTLYRPKSDGRIFQGYDGYIYVSGFSRLKWVGIPVSSEDFQVLPAALRRFGDAQS